MNDEELVPSLQDIHRDLNLLIDAVKDLTAAVHSLNPPPYPLVFSVDE